MAAPFVVIVMSCHDAGKMAAPFVVIVMSCHVMSERALEYEDEIYPDRFHRDF